MFPHWCKRSIPKRQTNLPLSGLLRDRKSVADGKGCPQPALTPALTPGWRGRDLFSVIPGSSLEVHGPSSLTRLCQRELLQAPEHYVDSGLTRRVRKEISRQCVENPAVASRPLISAPKYVRRLATPACTSATSVGRPSTTEIRSSKSWLPKKSPSRDP